MWFFGKKGASGFSARSTAEEVTHGVDGTGLTAIVTGSFLLYHKTFTHGLVLSSKAVDFRIISPYRVFSDSLSEIDFHL